MVTDSNDQATRKNNIPKVEILGYLMRLMTVGNNLVAKFWAPVNFAIIGLTFLKVYNVSLSTLQMFTLFGVAVASALLLGFFYDVLGLYAIEMSFDGSRNKEFDKINDKLEWLIKQNDLGQKTK